MVRSRRIKPRLSKRKKKSKNVRFYTPKKRPTLKKSQSKYRNSDSENEELKDLTAAIAAEEERASARANLQIAAADIAASMQDLQKAAAAKAADPYASDENVESAIVAAERAINSAANVVATADVSLAALDTTTAAADPRTSTKRRRDGVQNNLSKREPQNLAAHFSQLSSNNAEH